MQKSLNVATLLRAARSLWISATMLGLLVASFATAGCHPPAATLKPPQRHLNVPKLLLPAKIDRRNYARLRQLFDSLPRWHPQRAVLRDRLATYLVSKGLAQLDRPRRAAAALRTLFSATRLYDPAAVYEGKVRNPSLAKLAVAIANKYTPRGDTARVLPALLVQGGLEPARAKQLEAEFWRVVRWIDNTMEALYGASAKGHRVIPVLERTAVVWPSRFTLETLHKLYLEQRAALSNMGPLRGFLRRHSRFTFPVLRQTGYNLARLYLWVDQPYEALQRLRTLPRNDRNDTLRGLLERAVAPSANVDDLLRLAEEFEEHHTRVALRICQRASERFAAQARAHICVGRLAARAGNTLRAVSAYEQAHKLEPTSVKTSEALATQYERRIFLLVDSQQLPAARRRLQQLERFHQDAKKRLGKALKRSLASVYYAVGFGLFNSGDVAGAVETLRKSLAAEASPQALQQLALIKLKERDPAGALALLKRAEQLEMKSVAERVYWQARIESLRAQALTMAKDGRARAQQIRSIATWLQFARLGPKAPLRAEAEVKMARGLFALGRTADALDALDRAIDAAPKRKETYAEVISLLVMRGHLPEALDAYHRALGRPEVGEYLKTYCSLWVIGLAQRAGKPIDPLARTYLATLSGKRWYHRLAHLALGKVSYEQLESEARTTTQRAELYFYGAEKLLAAGKLEQAKKLWQKVVDTKMMAFFEYDMAMHNLHAGLAKVAEHPVDRQKDGTP